MKQPRRQGKTIAYRKKENSIIAEENIMAAPFRVDSDFSPSQRGPFAHRGLTTPSDGDSPLIEQPIRMVSIDTPEKNYGGGVALGQQKLDACRTRLGRSWQPGERGASGAASTHKRTSRRAAQCLNLRVGASA